MTRHRFPDRRGLTLADQLAASRAATAEVIDFPGTHPTADIIGLPDNLTPSDLADMADVVDCVGVFDCDAGSSRLPGSGDLPDIIDMHARLKVEGIT